MAKLDSAQPRPFPPGDYPVVVVGSGPGGLQTSHCLTALGVRHAVISDDDAPGGMFRRFPIFQRLITWSKLHATAARGTRRYEWFDWNSLLTDDPANKDLVPSFMDGTSYFPARREIEQGIAAFAERAGVAVRYGCRWEATRREEDGFTLITTDGEYRCRALVFAVGMAQPWKPPIDGMEEVPHYVEVQDVRHYAGKKVLIIGKRNSGFELADGLLPWASQIVLASPRPARISVMVHSTAAARARYLQPYEDHVLAGGNHVLDASIERIERTAGGWRIHLQGTTTPGAIVLQPDEVIAATGFTTPLQDLPELGVKTFYAGRLPAQTPFWESATAPGIYFAGAITQGSIGLKKYGTPSNSAAVHGFRYNARVLAERIAQRHCGIDLSRRKLAPGDVVSHLLAEASEAPELWNQQSYLARILERTPDGIEDAGIQPLAHFVDSEGPEAVAVAVETDASGDVHPAVYLRTDGRVDEHLLPSDPLHEFQTSRHSAELASLLATWTT